MATASMVPVELMSKRNLKVPAAAEVIGVSRGKVYQLMNSGILKSVHIDGARRIPLDALEAYMASLRGEVIGGEMA